MLTHFPITLHVCTCHFFLSSFSAISAIKWICLINFQNTSTTFVIVNLLFVTNELKRSEESEKKNQHPKNVFYDQLIATISFSFLNSFNQHKWKPISIQSNWFMVNHDHALYVCSFVQSIDDVSFGKNAFISLIGGSFFRFLWVRWFFFNCKLINIITYLLLLLQ